MKFTVLVPLADNNGTPFGEAKLMSVAQRFAIRFDGCTIDRNVEGLWYDGPTLYHDHHLRLLVKLDNARRDEVIEMARMIGRELQQKAMFVEIVESDGIQILQIPEVQ